MYDRIEGWFSNMGKKIKRLAIVSFIVETLICFIAALILMFYGMVEGYPGMIFGAFLIAILGPLIAYVGQWLLYGFGVLVERAENPVFEIQNTHDKMQQNQFKNTKKPKNERKSKKSSHKEDYNDDYDDDYNDTKSTDPLSINDLKNSIIPGNCELCGRNNCPSVFAIIDDDIKMVCIDCFYSSDAKLLNETNFENDTGE